MPLYSWLIARNSFWLISGQFESVQVLVGPVFASIQAILIRAITIPKKVASKLGWIWIGFGEIAAAIPMLLGMRMYKLALYKKQDGASSSCCVHLFFTVAMCNSLQSWNSLLDGSVGTDCHLTRCRDRRFGCGVHRHS